VSWDEVDCHQPRRFTVASICPAPRWPRFSLRVPPDGAGRLRQHLPCLVGQLPGAAGSPIVRPEITVNVCPRRARHRPAAPLRERTSQTGGPTGCTPASCAGPTGEPRPPPRPDNHTAPYPAAARPRRASTAPPRPRTARADTVGYSAHRVPTTSRTPPMRCRCARSPGMCLRLRPRRGPARQAVTSAPLPGNRGAAASASFECHTLTSVRVTTSLSRSTVRDADSGELLAATAPGAGDVSAPVG
jgi:hypothetical protein